jgi:outer membrane autotransporter protein
MGDLSGELANSGDITAMAAAASVAYQAEAYAYGIAMGSLSGDLVNSAAISAQATATGTSATVTAYGISLGHLSGTLVNSDSGVISATAAASATSYYASAYAYGIDLVNIDAGSLENSGAITATATGIAVEGSSFARAYAIGIDMASILNAGSLTNSGEITATAQGSGTSLEVLALGINMSSIVDGSLENSGEIRATAMALGTSAEATAMGISMVDIDSAGLLGNSGEISAGATAIGTSANAYADGINAVAVAAGGELSNSGSISATALASGSTAFARATGIRVTTMDGVLSNSGSISGSANLPENGYSLYIAAGSGTVENLAGGLLSGNLYVDGTIEVNNSGTIAIPAMEIANGNAEVAGDYNQDETGVLSVGAFDDATYGRLVVGGTAAFADDATLHVALVPGNVLAIGDELLDVVDAGTLVQNGFIVTDNSALLRFDYAIDGETVDLTLEQVSAAPMVAGAGWSSAIGAAGAFDHMLGLYGTGTWNDDNPAMAGVLADLRALETAQQVAEAIVTTLPSLNLELSRFTLGNLHNNTRLTRERQDAVRGLSSGDGAAGNGNLWVKPFGSWADQKSNNGAFGYDADTYGIVLGGDTALGSRASIGLGLAYSKSDVDGDSIAAQNADVKSYQAFLYGSYGLENRVDLSWHLGYGRHDNEVTRYVPLVSSIARADYDSWSMNAGVAVSRDYKMGEKTTLTPSVRLDYAYIDNDGYTENGAGPLNLIVSDSDTDELIFGIDGKLNHKLAQEWQFTANLGFGLDLLADDDTVTAAYAGAPGVAFSTHGTDPSTWLYRGGLGLVYGQANSLQVALRYDLEGRDDYTNQALSLKLNMPF